MINTIKCLSLAALFTAFLMAICPGSGHASDADPAKLPKQRADAIGYPSRDPNLDALPGFIEPPTGYGEVPFYWWLGDPLTKERLAWHLEQFKDMGISGLQINYAHSDQGGNIWGLTYPSDPKLFSKEWWDLVKWWSGECKKQGIAISLSDYTLGIVGQGYWMDEILAEDPKMRGSNLVNDIKQVKGGKTYNADMPDTIIGVTAYKIIDDKIVPDSAIDLRPFVLGKILKWDAPAGDWQVAIAFSRMVQNSVDPINPKTGPMIIDKFFGKFEKNMPGEGGKGLNFFFSDELSFGIGGNLWSDRFASEFKKRKGYDIVPKLAALFEDIGPETPKIRLDYRDVMVSLSEEAYFEPVFRWHHDRGMIYGCDHGGRGTDVAEFGDYFRTQRWMSGPGCDQPQLSADIVKNKVASSIAHLYERPRTWLEGYHSSGWGTNSAQITDATFKNYAMGQNLLSLHGLYYSTHGGFWEWAPPCNHFRMPYWAHMKDWTKAMRRLSYIMSQGVHRCDVAIIYPVASVEAGMDGGNAVGTAFDTGRRLYEQGIDFDYMDHESLARAKVVGNELHVSGEVYKVLVIPAMKAVRYTTMQKTLEFKKAGGTVVALGALPEASDKSGRDDAELNAMVKETFGESPTSFDNLKMTIETSIKRDFISPESCSVNHRKIGKRDVYMVVGANKGQEYFFNAKGKVELWDQWTGKTTPIYQAKATETGTRVTMPLGPAEAQLIVFSPGEMPSIYETNLDEIASVESDSGKITVTGFSSTSGTKTATVLTGNRTINLQGEGGGTPETIALDGLWEFEMKPTLDNRFGDFRLPITDQIIGAEARRFSYWKELEVVSGPNVLNDPTTPLPVKTYEFGQKFWKLGPLPKGTDTTALESDLAKLRFVDPSTKISLAGKDYSWEPYEYGLRQGVEGDPGHEGYHGLKENISSDFIALGKRNFTMTDSYYSNESDTAGRYYLWSAVRSDANVKASILTSKWTPSAVWLNGIKLSDLSQPIDIAQGATPIVLRYEQAGRGHFILQTGEDKPAPPMPLAMKWYQKPGVLQYDPMPELEKPVGWYKFTSPPGLRSMTIFAHGTIQAWANHIPMSLERKSRRADGAWKYIATAKESIAEPARITIRIQQDHGFYGGAAVPEPIALDCVPGLISLGDWCNRGLECYSGGAWYRKTVKLSSDQTKARIILNLGNLTSSAEIHVNGKLAATKLAPPWTIDISKYVKTGDNKIEILVYNTLANHYVTIPTRYRGDTASGLFGPVTVEIAKPIVLEHQLSE